MTDPTLLKKRSIHQFKYTMQLMRLTRLMGPSPNHIIHVDKDLTKVAGQTVQFSGGYPLNGAGQGDDGNTSLNAEAMNRRNMTLTVHENSNAVKSAGPMSLQRKEEFYKVAGFRARADEDLSLWRAERIENDIVTALSGGYNENASSGDVQTINEVAPSSNRIYHGGQSIGASAALGTSYATDALLTAGTRTNNLFGRLVIDHVVMLAKTATPRFRPGIYQQQNAGKEGSVSFGNQGPLIGMLYILLVSPQQMTHMRQDSQYADMVAAAANRGNLHPMLAGGNLLYNGVNIVEYDRIMTRTGAGGTTLAEGFTLNAARTATSDACVSGRSVARAILLGAQAGCFGWAFYPQLTENVEDTNKPVIKNTAIYGVKTTQMNQPGTETAMSEEGRYAIDTEY